MARFKYQDNALKLVGKLLDEENDRLLWKLAALKREQSDLAQQKIALAYEQWRF
jgi:hypothetical protein